MMVIRLRENLLSFFLKKNVRTQNRNTSLAMSERELHFFPSSPLYYNIIFTKDETLIWLLNGVHYIWIFIVGCCWLSKCKWFGGGWLELWDDTCSLLSRDCMKNIIFFVGLWNVNGDCIFFYGCWCNLVKIYCLKWGFRMVAHSFGFEIHSLFRQ